MRDLLKANVLFDWGKAQQDAFDCVKQALTNLPVLQYYSLSQEVTIQCDASKTGLGAALLQDGKPVAYASRSLSEAEARYAQIEKECLAIVFACEKFDHYIYGHQGVTVHSDHQPLESIFKKHLAAALACLQHMLLCLQRYNLNIRYLCGSQMCVTNVLSHTLVIAKSGQSLFINCLELVTGKEHSNVSYSCSADICMATSNDPVFQTLTKVILEGWPNLRANMQLVVCAYFNVRDELTVDSGLIYKGTRIVIPKSLRQVMLAKAHGGHVGMEGCIRHLKEALFWPGMVADAKAFIGNCDTCLSIQDLPRKEPLLSHSFPMRP